MAIHVIWTLSAQQDRIKVFEYWNERTQSRDYSQKLNELILQRILLIREYPYSGLKTDRSGVRFHLIARHYKKPLKYYDIDLPKPLLMIQEGNIRKYFKGFYKLFYKIKGERVYILRFWDTRQDPDKLNNRL